MGIRNYSPTDIQILVGGFYQLNGFVEDSFITITKDVDPYKTKRTADGRTARTFIKDDTYTITFTLAQSSPSNDILSKIYQADTLSQLGKFPLFVKDSSGSSLFLSPTTWIKEIPDMEFSNRMIDRVWVLQASDAVFSLGGNRDSSSDIEDALTILTSSIPTLKTILG